MMTKIIEDYWLLKLKKLSPTKYKSAIFIITALALLYSFWVTLPDDMKHSLLSQDRTMEIESVQILYGENSSKIELVILNPHDTEKSIDSISINILWLQKKFIPPTRPVPTVITTNKSGSNFILPDQSGSDFDYSIVEDIQRSKKNNGIVTHILQAKKKKGSNDFTSSVIWNYGATFGGYYQEIQNNISVILPAKQLSVISIEIPLELYGKDKNWNGETYEFYQQSLFIIPWLAPKIDCSNKQNEGLNRQVWERKCQLQVIEPKSIKLTINANTSVGSLTLEKEMKNPM
ncbi:hypothetical protein TUMSATVNIG1_57500 (plasmid) [Vibrio nigripulchritudo]|uniref:hypothetical protein n=1 Tax=Vibrio nigripulchritudo TaxID=28173 RepID=UPI00190B260C|nr:hypothetical protein [Vibrio nigripulchritudo]BCL73764.1 hypothetical protein VNTUMSATTG_57010 [Vibrio nigripulchritudo]BDU35141.1 hypothetical protein TUMSATVNIG1_57500 [Vibrio nigripulchritudo]